MSFLGRTFTSLGRRDFRRYFAGHVTSVVGFWIRIVIQGWLVYELTGSRTLLGAVTAASLLPLVLLSPVGGLLGDRVDRRSILLWTPLVAVAGNATLGVLVILGSIQVGHIFVVAVVIGAARAIEIPVRNAFVRDVVGLENLGNAIALNAAGFNVARVVGPALGAVLLKVIGMGPCFLVAAAAQGAMTVALLGIHAPSSQPTRPSGSPVQQLAEGLRYVRGHRRTRTLIMLLAITILFTWTYQTVMAAFAKDRLGLDESGYSLLTSVPGVGALVGALWVAGRMGRVRPRRGLVSGLVWGGAAAVFLLGLVHQVGWAIPGLVAVGFCQVGFMASANAMVQESVPDALRSRVMGLWVFTFGLCFPVGAMLQGLVSQATSLTVTWSGGAVMTLLLSLVVWLTLPRRSAARAPPAEVVPEASLTDSPPA
ncbi:MAG: MFS transporter [Planctomycetota bacterium]